MRSARARCMRTIVRTALHVATHANTRMRRRAAPALARWERPRQVGCRLTWTMVAARPSAKACRGAHVTHATRGRVTAGGNLRPRTCRLGSGCVPTSASSPSQRSTSTCHMRYLPRLLKMGTHTTGAHPPTMGAHPPFTVLAPARSAPRTAAVLCADGRRTARVLRAQAQRAR
jgi:hypothetical protein